MTRATASSRKDWAPFIGQTWTYQEFRRAGRRNRQPSESISPIDFFGFPGEIRNNIYDFVAAHNGTTLFREDTMNLLQTCHQVRAEYLEIHHGSYEYDVEPGRLHAFVKAIVKPLQGPLAKGEKSQLFGNLRIVFPHYSYLEEIFPVIDFHEKYPNHRLTFACRTVLGEIFPISARGRSRINKVLNNTTPAWRSWIEQKAMVSIRLAHNIYPLIYIVMKHRFATPLMCRGSSTQRVTREYCTEIGFKGLSVGFGIRY